MEKVITKSCKLFLISEELSISRDVILNTVENIYKSLIEQTPLVVEKNSSGCDICGYSDVNR